MNRHETRLARSLAFHREVARRLAAQPELLHRARRQALRLATEGGRAASSGERWLGLLDGERSALVQVLTDDAEDARAPRSATPFAGALPPLERLAI